MTDAPIRILIVDDHTIVRKGIRALLAEIEDIEVVGEATTGQEAIKQAESLNPDVILMDLVMPGMDGVEAIRHISIHQPKARILVLTSFTADESFSCYQSGCVGLSSQRF